MGKNKALAYHTSAYFHTRSMVDYNMLYDVICCGIVVYDIVPGTKCYDVICYCMSLQFITTAYGQWRRFASEPMAQMFHYSLWCGGSKQKRSLYDNCVVYISLSFVTIAPNHTLDRLSSGFTHILISCLLSR